MPYIEINDKNQLVGISAIKQIGFKYVDEIPTDVINIFENSKKIKESSSELSTGDHKIIRYLERKESGKQTKISKKEFDKLSDSRDQLRDKIKKLNEEGK